MGGWLGGWVLYWRVGMDGIFWVWVLGSGGLVAQIVCSREGARSNKKKTSMLDKGPRKRFQSSNKHPQGIIQVRAIAVRLTRPSDDVGYGRFAISTNIFPSAPGVVVPNQPFISQRKRNRVCKGKMATDQDH